MNDLSNEMSSFPEMWRLKTSINLENDTLHLKTLNLLIIENTSFLIYMFKGQVIFYAH